MIAGSRSETVARLSRHEVARQVDLGRLWIILDGQVVDATDFARWHPGGAGVIARLSGMDASADFKAAGHSAQAQARVAGLVVGVIEDDTSQAQGADTYPRTSARGPSDGLQKLAAADLRAASPWRVEGRALEFHTRRRLEMLAKYPEIEQLYGQDVWPWVYGSFCFSMFVFVGAWCGTNIDIPFTSYTLLQLPWWGIVLAAWLVLPWLAFGLNNLNHEICHGNVWGLPRQAGAVIQLLAGCVTLNHFLFYYYYHSHLSHHQHLGEGDRGRAWRQLFVRLHADAVAAADAERSWDVDGDLYGMHPPLAVLDSASHVASIPCPIPCAGLVVWWRACSCFFHALYTHASKRVRAAARQNARALYMYVYVHLSLTHPLTHAQVSSKQLVL